jgi:hypothetical protein
MDNAWFVVVKDVVTMAFVMTQLQFVAQIGEPMTLVLGNMGWLRKIIAQLINYVVALVAQMFVVEVFVVTLNHHVVVRLVARGHINVILQRTVVKIPVGFVGVIIVGLMIFVLKKNVVLINNPVLIYVVMNLRNVL